MEMIALNSFNVPEWLKDSELGKKILEKMVIDNEDIDVDNDNDNDVDNEDDTLMIEEQYYKENPITKIDNINQWLYALKIYKFWGKEFPNFFIIYFLAYQEELSQYLNEDKNRLLFIEMLEQMKKVISDRDEKLSEKKFGKQKINK